MAQLSINEVAQQKHVSARTVYRAVGEGHLSVQRVGRALLVASEAAELWTPMLTKARPQVRGATTLEAALGYRGLGPSRHFAVAIPDSMGHRAFIKRLMGEAIRREAGLVLAAWALSVSELE